MCSSDSARFGSVGTDFFLVLPVLPGTLTCYARVRSTGSSISSTPAGYSSTQDSQTAATEGLSTTHHPLASPCQPGPKSELGAASSRTAGREEAGVGREVDVVKVVGAKERMPLRSSWQWGGSVVKSQH